MKKSLLFYSLKKLMEGMRALQLQRDTLTSPLRNKKMFINKIACMIPPCTENDGLAKKVAEWLPKAKSLIRSVIIDDRSWCRKIAIHCL